MPRKRPTQQLPVLQPHAPGVDVAAGGTQWRDWFATLEEDLRQPPTISSRPPYMEHEEAFRLVQRISGAAKGMLAAKLQPVRLHIADA